MHEDEAERTQPFLVQVKRFEESRNRCCVL
jgi:hypothetical protein